MDSLADSQLSIELAFATPEVQKIWPLTMPLGSSVDDVLGQIDWAQEFPEVELEQCGVGIWGEVCERGATVADGDRVEVYRPLRIDPREMRRILVSRGETMSSATADASQDLPA